MISTNKNPINNELMDDAVPVNSVKQQEKRKTKMATEDMLSDIRREQVEHTNEIVKEGLKGDFATLNNIKDARFDINSRIEGVHGGIENRFFDTARDVADIRAQLVAQQQQMAAGFATTAKDSEINALRTQVELAKQTTYLSDKIDGQADTTRALINDLRYHDLNRALVERNSELVEERWGRRHYRGLAEQNQWAALNTQLQAFGSQLQETRQGMVNFGTMAGVGQTSSSNNV